MYTSSPVDFHLITDEESQTYLSAVLELIEKPAHDIRIYFYPISLEAMEERLLRTAVWKKGQPRYMEMRTTHQSGTRELFSHRTNEIFTNVTAGMMKVVWAQTSRSTLICSYSSTRSFPLLSREAYLLIPTHSF